MRSRIYQEILISVLMFGMIASCTIIPYAAPSISALKTDTKDRIPATDAPVLTETPTMTGTPTITQTPTPPPDVELAQLQVKGTVFFAEIINHLKVPVVFEDQQPAVLYDVYDPKLDEHFQGEEPIDRFNNRGAVPCVLYPGEKAFFLGTRSFTLGLWASLKHSPRDQLKITYQTLGKPRPDWPEKERAYKVWDEKWDIQGEMMNFSFRHTPYKPSYGYWYFNQGTMGLYDKDNHLLGVAVGPIDQTIETGLADGYSINFDNASRGDFTRLWLYIGPDDAKTRVDHIALMVEVLPDIDGTCVKRPSTVTP
jgi:hypothetical protein